MDHAGATRMISSNATHCSLAPAVVQTLAPWLLSRKAHRSTSAAWNGCGIRGGHVMATSCRTMPIT